MCVKIWDSPVIALVKKVLCMSYSWTFWFFLKRRPPPPPFYITCRYVKLQRPKIDILLQQKLRKFIVIMRYLLYINRHTTLGCGHDLNIVSCSMHLEWTNSQQKYLVTALTGKNSTENYAIWEFNTLIFFWQSG